MVENHREPLRLGSSKLSQSYLPLPRDLKISLGPVHSRLLATDIQSAQ